MASEWRTRNLDLANGYLVQHGVSPKDHGISTSGLGLSPAKAAEFIRILEDLEIPLPGFEIWRWYVEERGRHTYWSSWDASSASHRNYASAREALSRTSLKSSDLVIFTSGISDA
jgi:hypothetical protein